MKNLNKLFTLIIITISLSCSCSKNLTTEEISEIKDSKDYSQEELDIIINNKYPCMQIEQNSEEFSNILYSNQYFFKHKIEKNPIIVNGCLIFGFSSEGKPIRIIADIDNVIINNSTLELQILFTQKFRKDRKLSHLVYMYGNPKYDIKSLVMSILENNTNKQNITEVKINFIHSFDENKNYTLSYSL